ncbi:hypothetical protein ALC62_08864, partial [Cyphomyrmex costatus]
RYNVQWYEAPLHIQRMILFLLQKEVKEFTLNVGGLFNASMECFATVIYYRIERAMKIFISQNITLKNKISKSENLIYAVIIHREAMRYNVQWYVAPLHIQRMILFLLLKGTKDFTIIVGGILVSSIECFATNIFHLQDTKISSNTTSPDIEMKRFQNIKKILQIYNVQWYKTPLCIQRMILFLLQVGMKEFTIHIGGIFDPSMKSFATVI